LKLIWPNYNLGQSKSKSKFQIEISKPQ
jgi:hypothetical protein